MRLRSEERLSEFNFSDTQREAAHDEIAATLKTSAEWKQREWEAIAQEVRQAGREDSPELVLAEILKEAREALKREQARLALVLADKHERAVLTLDANGLITGVCTFSARLLGREGRDLIGMPIDILLRNPENSIAESADEMRRSEDGEAVHSIREHTRGNGGANFTAEHSLFAIVGPLGLVTGFVREIRDLSQQQVHELAIEELNTAIAVLSKA